mmetsp:Transcript_34468/g.112232  ORF Transcript_34468/g.112232 Transcript_34468/m.112232 type:complete len:334 (+) Transcript_34468:611-1612(+)
MEGRIGPSTPRSCPRTTSLDYGASHSCPLAPATRGHPELGAAAPPRPSRRGCGRRADWPWQAPRPQASVARSCAPTRPRRLTAPSLRSHRSERPCASQSAGRARLEKGCRTKSSFLRRSRRSSPQQPILELGARAPMLSTAARTARPRTRRTTPRALARRSRRSATRSASRHPPRRWTPRCRQSSSRLSRHDHLRRVHHGLLRQSSSATTSFASALPSPTLGGPRCCEAASDISAGNPVRLLVAAPIRARSPGCEAWRCVRAAAATASAASASGAEIGAPSAPGCSAPRQAPPPNSGSAVGAVGARRSCRLSCSRHGNPRSPRKQQTSSHPNM